MRGQDRGLRGPLREQVDDEDEHADRHVEHDGLGVDDQAAHEDRASFPAFLFEGVHLVVVPHVGRRAPLFLCSSPGSFAWSSL